MLHTKTDKTNACTKIFNTKLRIKTCDTKLHTKTCNTRLPQRKCNAVADAHTQMLRLIFNTALMEPSRALKEL